VHDGLLIAAGSFTLNGVGAVGNIAAWMGSTGRASPGDERASQRRGQHRGTASTRAGSSRPPMVSRGEHGRVGWRALESRGPGHGRRRALPCGVPGRHICRREPWSRGRDRGDGDRTLGWDELESSRGLASRAVSCRRCGQWTTG
jgi:hypothetical protein